MKIVKKIVFYDHDGTLMDVPMPETGKLVWKNKTGNDYPHTGWWGQLDSLNTKVFDILPFPTIHEKFIQDSLEEETMTVLLTNRLPKFENHILDMLKIHDITFDDHSFKADGKNKKERILTFLEKHPSVEEVHVYDDQQDQIDILKELIAEHGQRIKISVFHTIEGEVKRIE